MDKAQRMNMGKDIVQRAIAKASKSQEADNLVNIRYEGYGPAGVAFWVHALTDNRNRTVAEVRHAFSTEEVWGLRGVFHTFLVIKVPSFVKVMMKNL